MGKRKSGRWLTMIALAAVIGWPTYQLYDWISAKRETRDAAQLLYQVALFQIELLNSSLQSAAGATNTEQLNALKQAVYSAEYAHERLVLAFGEDRLTALSSMAEMMQWIMRLQLGGSREIRPEETGALKETGVSFKALYDTYASLMSSGGEVIPSKNDDLIRIDRELTGLLRGKRLK